MVNAIVSIVVALISGGLALIGVIVTNKTSENNIKTSVQAELRIAQAVTDEKINELTREVREHNNFAKRMPVLEEKVKELEKKVEK